jgi:signal transduction histidine kinase
MVEPARDTSDPGGARQPSAYPAYPRPDAPGRPPHPPLTKRMRRVHWIILDCGVGGFAAVVGAAGISGDLSVQHAKGPIILLFMALLFAPVALRRTAPGLSFGALIILGVLLSGMRPVVPGLIFLAVAYVLYTLTVESRRRSGIAALVLVLAVLVALAVTGPGSRPQDGSGGEFIPIALANIIAWMTGYSVRQRRRYVVSMQEQATSKAVAEERLRIARELHDVVAHSMSVIAVQAGYGQYVIDVSPENAKEALGAIQATSRDALEEMRRMLGVLRQQDVPREEAPSPFGARADAAAADSGESSPARSPAGSPSPAPLAPAPGLAGLDRLIGRTCGAGVRVSLSVSGRARPAPGTVDLSAYRIIQEALTNVVRHAGTGAECTVSLCYTDADLVIEVTDDGGRPRAQGGNGPGAMAHGIAGGGSGHGIIGMQERVNLCGGTFHARPLPAGGFQVVATLPLPVVAAPAARTAPSLRTAGAVISVDVPLGIGMPSAADAVTAALTGAPDGRPLDDRLAVRPNADLGERGR